MDKYPIEITFVHVRHKHGSVNVNKWLFEKGMTTPLLPTEKALH